MLDHSNQAATASPDQKTLRAARTALKTAIAECDHLLEELGTLSADDVEAKLAAIEARRGKGLRALRDALAGTCPAAA